MICPLLSRAGEMGYHCLKEECAFYIKDNNPNCAIVKIALWMPLT